MARPEGQWMPVYVADYLADTQHLTTVQHGAYLLLLFAYWRKGEALPDNDAILSQIARLSLKEWRSIRPVMAQLFDVASGVWWSKRTEKELIKAAANYEAKAQAGAKGAAKRWQRHSKPIAQPSVCQSQTDAPSPSPSPNGDKHPSDVLATKAKRRSQIPADWQPTAKDIAHATDRNLDRQTVANLVEPFRDHHIAKQTLSADWSASWRTWVKNHIHFNGTGPWPRPDAGRSNTNAGHRQSVSAARDRILAKAGVVQEPHGTADRGIRTDQAGWASSPAESEGFAGPIIDADDWERVLEPADGTEGHDTSHPGDDGRRGDATHSVSETVDGMAGGRCEEGSDDASGPQPVVAVVAGTEVQIGPVREQTPPNAEGSDPLEIPDFMRRKRA